MRRPAARRGHANSDACARLQRRAVASGLIAHAGHGLDYHNVQPVAAMPELVGAEYRARDHCARGHRPALRPAVAEMKRLMREARGGMIFGIGTDVVRIERDRGESTSGSARTSSNGC